MTPQPQDDLEHQYNPRKAVAEVEVYMRRASERSAEARRRLEARCDIAYGPRPLERLDLFPASPGGPLHVFLHGGYWRGRDKRDYSYVASTLVPAGINTVVLNYDLCPAVALDAIVAQIRRAFRWIADNAEALGGRRDAIFASGHSAGAHLIAMALAEDAGADALPRGLLKGAALISGIYDLAPVLNVSVNAEIGLDPELAARMSPMRHPPQSGTPLEIVVGGSETREWVRQSRDFAALCRGRGLDCDYHETAGDNHYSIIEALADRRSALTALLLGQMGR